MPAHGHYGEIRGVRWDADLGEFVMRCDDCVAAFQSSYWPLTLEFWNPRTMQRCRACEGKRRKAVDRKRRSNPEYAERERQRARAYHKANWDVMSPKHTLRMREWRAKKKEQAA